MSRDTISHFRNLNRYRFDKEYRIVTRNGEERWIGDRTFAYRNDKGEITHYRCIILDVTGYKESREAIAEIKDFYKGILDTIVTGVWVTDEHDVVKYANRGLERINRFEPGRG